MLKSLLMPRKSQPKRPPLLKRLRKMEKKLID